MELNQDQINYSYKPVIFRLSDINDAKDFELLKSNVQELKIFDNIYAQIVDLAKCRNPSIIVTSDFIEKFIDDFVGNATIEKVGVWVYYPWTNFLVHILDELDFIEVRTNRNQLKITKNEQQHLASKKVGIIGLSVGNSIALTMAQERICGHLKLADFDVLDLSNINRIRTGLNNIGIPKVIFTAREIAEIDPFIHVEVFTSGFNVDNEALFFQEGGNLDLVIEVCDNMQTKIDCRMIAKKLQVPVVMDTNDRGMIDVERFDLDSERPIFHGMLNRFFNDNKIVVDNNNKNSILASIIQFDELSERMKFSMAEIGKTINSWPQLASAVVLGGAITTDLARKILLGQHNSSGRYYVDIDNIFSNNTDAKFL